MTMWDGIRNRKNEAEKASTPGEVKSYQSSPEELEKYRSNTAVTKIEKKPLNLQTKPKKELEPVQKELTKEIYLKLHSEGKLDKDVMEKFNMNHNLFYKLKKQWGLTGTNHKGKNSNSSSNLVEPAPLVEDTARKQQIEELKKELNRVTKPAIVEVPVVEKVIETVIEKPCECKVTLEAKIIELQSRLALKDKRNEELEQSIAALKKYRSLYFVTVEALKVHLP